MAFIGLIGGSSGDLQGYSSANYGYFNDTVVVLFEFTDRQYLVSTYEGNDRIDFQRVSFGSSQFIYAGSGNDTILGGAGNETSNDGSGNDSVFLGGGTDIANVGIGNDRLDGGAGLDEISFAFVNYDGGAGGNEFNTVGVTCDLTKTTAQNFGVFGTDTIRNFEGFIGGDGSDSALGTTANNNLSGRGGNDFLSGRGGADNLIAGEGSDTLVGGGGKDVHFLGEATAARDIVRFTAMSDSSPLGGTSSDLIFNFAQGSAATADRIDLSAIDANTAASGNQAFIFRGTGAFSSAAGEVRLNVVGPDTLVFRKAGTSRSSPPPVGGGSATAGERVLPVRSPSSVAFRDTFPQWGKGKSERETKADSA
jgi:Ca2+-binding RTX toxin-like protein